MTTDDLKSAGERALLSLDEDDLDLEGQDQILVEEEPELSPAEAQKVFEQKVARVAQVLSRGAVNDKLAELLEQATPAGRVGKFVRENDAVIVRHKNLGYTFDVNTGVQGHGTGDKRVRLGDCVVMTISLEDYVVLIEANRRGVQKKIGMGKQEYKSVTSRGDMAPTFDESSTIIG